VSVTDEMDRLISPSLMGTILSSGYNVDFIDAEAIASVGIHYPILVLPPTDRLPTKTLHAIQRYVAGGGKVIVVGRAPSLDEDGKKLASGFPVVEEASLSAALHQAVAPDFVVDEDQDEVGFIRRKLPGRDVYFVANTSNHPVNVEAKFHTTHPFGQRWDVDSGDAISRVERVAPLSLAPYESAVFVFGDSPFAGASAQASGTMMTDLSSGWTRKFAGTGEQKVVSLPDDWSSTDQFYSGEVDYTKTFTAAGGIAFLEIDGGLPLEKPAATKGPGMRAWFDPPVREAAVVFVNGRRVGALWHPPYRLDLAGFLKQGENTIMIRVFNTAINAWAGQAARDYQPLIEKFGDRFQMQDLDQVKPVPSGLIGTVRLMGR
jgi:hypothetical protein